jgi:uncharacterized Tic20 family protein
VVYLTPHFKLNIMIKILFYLFLSMVLVGAGTTVVYNGMVGFVGLVLFLLGLFFLILLVHYDLEKHNL